MAAEASRAGRTQSFCRLVETQGWARGAAEVPCTRCGRGAPRAPGEGPEGQARGQWTWRWSEPKPRALSLSWEGTTPRAVRGGEGGEEGDAEVAARPRGHAGEGAAEGHFGGGGGGGDAGVEGLLGQAEGCEGQRGRQGVHAEEWTRSRHSEGTFLPDAFTASLKGRCKNSAVVL